ncbi:hypothetical protein [Herbiconiux sp. YIM B11900]|uniref:hypothetical protein n=1 Tax=Herbiconiux sp. YIM B11900 TaxID=3404131 RepID=UPI003F8703DE
MAVVEECQPFDIACKLGEGAKDIISQASNDAVQELMNRVLEGLGKALASIGTMWVNVPTPVLTAGNGTGVLPTNNPGADQFTMILSYVSYIGLAIAVLSIIALGALMALQSRRGEGIRNAGKLGVIFIAILLISGASALVGGLLSARAPEGSSSTVGFLQNALWYWVGGLAILSIIIAGIRMAWEQRAQPGKDLIQSLITLVVVSGTGLAVITLATTAADQFSVWILQGATNCDVSAAGSQCFGTNMATLITLTASSPIGVIGVLILGAIALLMTYVQVALMVIRGGLLVVLAGALPLTASFTNTQMGKQWFGKMIGWTLAFILYKPAAALIYAAAFSLAGTDAFQKDGGGIYSILTGLALMLMALIALPALLKFVAPMTGAVAGGGAAGLALAGAAGMVGGEVASGAVRRMSNSGNSGGGVSGGGGDSSPSGASMAGKGSPTPTPSPAGASGGGAGSAASSGASGGGAAAGGAAAGAGAGAGAAAGGAAAAGPAAPIVMGAQMVKERAKAVGEAAQGAVQSAADDSTGA